jgi:hypothetical protein
MTSNSEFNKWFEEIAPKLVDREISFRKIFKYLDSLPDPIIIVETGCLRTKDNFLDGQSTLLFDKYTLARGKESKVYTVDINPESTNTCRKIVSDNVEITTSNSVKYLNNFVNEFSINKKKVSMFYLDSFDVDWRYPYPSAAHHLKELTAINKILYKDTLVVVDDAPAVGNLTHNNNKWEILKSPAPVIGGKGFLVHEFAEDVGAKVFFSHYQTGWLGFNK